MTRRELLRLGGSSLLYAGLAPLAPLAAATVPSTDGRRLFFTPADLPRILSNTRTPLLSPLYAQWAASPPEALGAALDRFEASGDMIRDFLGVLRELAQGSLVQLVEPDPARARSLLDALERIIVLPHWDYFRDGGTKVLGIQRASFTTVRLLFAREVLGSKIAPDLDRRLLAAIAEKGCLACFHTVHGMDHPETVVGWDFDERHAGFYDITMDRWPMILGANNLRAAPASALGLGALALLGVDSRAEAWLSTAVASTRRFLKLISPDGGFFEGISYLSYSLRTTLPFIEAHRRLVGDVDWGSLVNFEGMLEHIMTMQMGRTPDGRPDIVNFSDSRESVFAGAISLIGRYTGHPLAGYAAREASRPEWIYDFLWYEPEAPSQPPRPGLLNHRNDLNWIVCRSGWEPGDTVLAFKSGGPANHEHADRNHLTLKAHGERLLNDHFGAAYDRRHPGWKMRFTEAHNAVLIDGQGHAYLDGSEGTNDSQAYANLLHFEDRGEHVWWTSDATAAYILNNYHAHQVLRTVLFAKPSIVVVIDQIRLRYRPQTVAARFFPDHADGLATLAVEGPRFTLGRPGARLHGLVASDTGAMPRLARLDVPPETGDFPCVEVHSPEALEHHLVTVLAIEPANSRRLPAPRARREGNVWDIEAPGLRARVVTTPHAPRLELR
jgi:hypothetical protein